jgi:DNA-binding CsgD family transcriptional regulator
MTGDDITKLTEAQRECLRLVMSHHNTKEIAQRLGLSPSAIDKRLERAVQALGASSRFEAARMLHEYEGGRTWERLPSDPIDVPQPDLPAPSSDQIEPFGFDRRIREFFLGEGGAGRARNRLGKLQRIGVVLGLMVLLSIAGVAMLNMAMTLASLARITGFGLPHGS